MGRTIIARRRKSASAGALEAVQQVFDAGNAMIENLSENVPELGGEIFGVTYKINQADTGLSDADWQAAGNQIANMGPEQLARFVGSDKKTMISDICREFSIGASDKDFSGGGSITGSELQIDLYLMGGAQYTD